MMSPCRWKLIGRTLVFLLRLVLLFALFCIPVFLVKSKNGDWRLVGVFFLASWLLVAAAGVVRLLAADRVTRIAGALEVVVWGTSSRLPLEDIEVRDIKCLQWLVGRVLLVSASQGGRQFLVVRDTDGHKEVVAICDSQQSQCSA